MPRRLAVLAAGAWSLAAQTVLLREAIVTTRGGAFVASVFLATWLAGVAAGAWVGRGASPSTARRRLPGVLLVSAPLVGAQAWAFHVVPPLVGLDPAQVVPLERLLPLLVPLVTPAAFLSGLAFPLLAAGTRDATPRLYAWESLGCFAGGVGITLFVLAGGSALGATGAGLAVLGVAAATVGQGRIRWLALLAVAAGLGGLLAGGRPTGVLARQDLRGLLPDATLVAAADTPQGRWAVARRPGQAVVIRDGAVVGTWPDGGDVAWEVALAMSQAAGPQARTPRRVLVLATHPGPLVEALRHYPEVERVDVLEEDPRARTFLDAHLPAELRAALADPRVRRHTGDPRAFVATATEPWDLVLLPAASGTERGFQALEFHRALGRVLSPGGVVATAVAGGASYEGPEVAAVGGSVLATLEAAWPAVAVLPGAPTRLYGASRRILDPDPEVLARRHRRIPREPTLPEAGAFPSLVDVERRPWVEATWRRADPTGASLVDSDRHPRAWLLAVMVQGRHAGSDWVAAVQRLRATGPALWAVPLATLLLFQGLRLWRRSPGQDGARDPELGAWVLAAAGFTSLSLDVLLLHLFQARAGTLFGRVGLLHGVLLAGLAAGAALGRLLVARWDGRLPPGGMPRTLVAVLLATAGGALILPLVLPRLPTGPAAEPALLGLAAVAGVLSGMAFPAGAALVPPDEAEGHRAGLLFAADHLGAMVAALLAGTLVVPLAGVTGAAHMVAGVQGVVLALLLIRRLRPRTRRRTAPRVTFPWPRATPLLAAAAVSALLLGGAGAWRLRSAATSLDPATLAATSGAESWETRDAPFPHLAGVDRQGRLREVAVRSGDVVQGVIGYGGPLDLLVVVDQQGRYRRVQVLSHRETPSYLARVVPWMEGLVGRSVGQDLALETEGGDVDAISGATVTARAVLRATNGVGRAVGSGLLGQEAREPMEAPTRNRSVQAWFLLAVPLGLLVLYRGGPRLRLLALAVVLVVGGVLLDAQVALDTLLGPLDGRLPSWTGPPAELLLLVILVLLALSGATWCGVLCPFGALQELAGAVGLRLGVSPAADRRLRGVKYLVLGLLVAAYALTSAPWLLAGDPLARAFGDLRQQEAGMLALVLLAGGSTLVVYRAWCRYLCPVGAALTLADRLAPLARLLPARRFGRCDLGVVSPADLDCIRCSRCRWLAAPVPGPTTPPRLAGPAPRPPRDRVAGVVVVVLLLAMGVAMATSGTPARSPRGGGQAVDTERLRSLVEQGSLSDHEAAFWHPVEEPTAP